MADAETPILVTAIEAAVWTGRPRGTIWRWASEGRIRKHPTPGGVRYDLRDLEPATDGRPGRPPAKRQEVAP